MLSGRYQVCLSSRLWFFFDDLVSAFLKERSLVSFTPFVQAVGEVALFNVVLGGRRRVTRVGGASQVLVVQLPLKVLRRQLSARVGVGISAVVQLRRVVGVFLVTIE